MDKEDFLQLLSWRLTRELSVQEARNLDEVLAANEAYRRQAEILTAYFQMERQPTMTNRFKLAGLWEAIEATESLGSSSEPDDQVAPPVRLWRSGWLRLAVIILFCIGIGITLYRYLQTPAEPVFVVIRTGEEKQFLTLADGTFIRLNKSSILRYNAGFGKEHRTVSLQGEAYFEVTKNERVPLVLDAGRLRVTVKGTAFHVSAYDDAPKASVSLIEGSVEVSAAGDGTSAQGTPVLLRPMQKLELERERSSKPKVAFFTKDSLMTALGWWPINDTLSFHNEPLDAVWRKLSKKFNVQIVVRSPKLNDIRISGTLRDDTTLETVLEALQVVFPMKCRIAADNTVIIE